MTLSFLTELLFLVGFVFLLGMLETYSWQDYVTVNNMKDESKNLLSYTSAHAVWILFLCLIKLFFSILNVYDNMIYSSNMIIFLDEKQYVVHWIKDMKCWYFMEKKKVGYEFSFYMHLPKNAFDHYEKYTTSVKCHKPSPPIDEDNIMIPLLSAEEDNTIIPF